MRREEYNGHTNWHTFVTRWTLVDSVEQGIRDGVHEAPTTPEELRDLCHTESGLDDLAVGSIAHELLWDCLYNETDWREIHKSLETAGPDDES